VSRCSKEAEEACASTKETLTRLRQEKEEKGSERSDLTAEARTLLNSVRSSVDRRDKMKWALAAGPLLAVAAVMLSLRK